MVLRAGGGAFRKLSIPRDTLAAIPGCGEQKINASLPATRTAAAATSSSTIKTVEDFLGIDIDHVVILDFDGFADFIDALGGIKVDLDQAQVCGDDRRRRARTAAVSIQLAAASTRSRATRRCALRGSGRTTATRRRTTSTAPSASS